MSFIFQHEEFQNRIILPHWIVSLVLRDIQLAPDAVIWEMNS